METFYKSRYANCVSKARDYVKNGQVNSRVVDKDATPIFEMIDCFSYDAVRLLIDAGGEINIVDNTGATPLEKAIMSCYTAQRVYQDYPSVDFRQDSQNIVEILINSRANVNVRASDGDNLLGCAFFVKNINIVRWLLYAGFNINSLARNNIPNLFNAIMSELPEAVDLLLNAGANSNMVSGGRTPLYWAIEKDSPQMVASLLRHGAKAGWDEKHKSWEKCNPLIQKQFGIFRTDESAPPPPYNPNAKPGGCYIATAVYGSYDAPEVLVLRSFRDNVLAKHILGQWFIKVYYRLSPQIAAKLKSGSLISKAMKTMLDRFVFRLNH